MNRRGNQFSEHEEQILGSVPYRILTALILQTAKYKSSQCSALVDAEDYQKVTGDEKWAITMRDAGKAEALLAESI